MYMRDISFNHS